MKCNQIDKIAPQLLRREVDSEMRLDVISHLRQCVECRKIYFQYHNLFYSIDRNLVEPAAEIDINSFNNSVKQKIVELTNYLFSEIPEIRFGAMAYGWAKYSEYPQEDPRNYLEFTDSKLAICNFIESLYADGGVEPWGDALWLANSWTWRSNAKKLYIHKK